jgi:pimeloyl-ACP methyl ester carboxylesterase
MHYAREGESGTDLVLFHCYNTTWRLYERALPLLGARTRALALDGPGTGLSEPLPNDEVTFPEVAEIFAEALAALGVHRPVLGGLHTGARMALQVAKALGPDRVSGLVLTGPGRVNPIGLAPSGIPKLDYPPDAEATQWERARSRYVTIFPSEQIPTEPDGWLQHMYLVASMSKCDQHGLSWGGAVPADWEIQSFYESLTVPILFLNTPEDCFASSDELLAPLNPSAQLRMIENIGPHLMLRDPEVYTREVFAFLDQHAL